MTLKHPKLLILQIIIGIFTCLFGCFTAVFGYCALTNRIHASTSLLCTLAVICFLMAAVNLVIAFRCLRRRKQWKQEHSNH